MKYVDRNSAAAGASVWADLLVRHQELRILPADGSSRGPGQLPLRQRVHEAGLVGEEVCDEVIRGQGREVRQREVLGHLLLWPEAPGGQGKNI